MEAETLWSKASVDKEARGRVSALVVLAAGCVVGVLVCRAPCWSGFRKASSAVGAVRVSRGPLSAVWAGDALAVVSADAESALAGMLRSTRLVVSGAAAVLSVWAVVAVGAILPQSKALIAFASFVNCTENMTDLF